MLFADVEDNIDRRHFEVKRHRADLEYCMRFGGCQRCRHHARMSNKKPEYSCGIQEERVGKEYIQKHETQGK